MDNLKIDKWMFVLPVLLGEGSSKNVSDICREINVTYAHMATSILPLLISHGMVNKRFEGRENKISLTRKGIRVADLINSLSKELELGE